MSFIPFVDPHPGRCLNFRSVHHADGHTENLRCLDYEGVAHVCSFPPSTHVSSAGGSYSFTPTQPVQWVKPSAGLD